MEDNSQATELAIQLVGQSLQDHVVQQELNEKLPIPSADQNLLGVWYYDEDIHENKDVWFRMRYRLYTTFTYVRIFNNQHEFHQYFKRSLTVQNIFFIGTGKHAKGLCFIASRRPQFRKIYEFQISRDSVKSSFLAFIDIDNLFNQIHDDLKSYATVKEPSSTKIIQDDVCHRLALSLPLSIFNSNKKQNSFRYWNKESLEFYRFHALTGILTKMSCDLKKSINDMMRECRQRYIRNSTQLKEIDTVQDKYDGEFVIWYYTRDSFFFRSVGHVFRSEDIECIFKFRRCIIDLHHQLGEIASGHQPTQRTLYRGKKLPAIVLQQLEDNIGDLMSINGFLSTTQNRRKAIEVFAGIDTDRADYESVLFELSIDEAIITRSFADISWISQFPEEEEVLFTMGTVWRIGDVVLDQDNNSLWIVKLKSCNELNTKLAQFFEQLPGDNTFLALGDVLCELGQYTKAKNFYGRMLKEQNLTKETYGTLHYKIAMINMAQGANFEALQNLEDAGKVFPSVTTNIQSSSYQPSNIDSSSTLRLRILYNKGLLYQKTDDYDNALLCFTEALAIEDSNLVERAKVHNSLGLLFFNDRSYTDALKHLEEAVTLTKGHSCVAKFQQDFAAVKRHVSSEQS